MAGDEGWFYRGWFNRGMRHGTGTCNYNDGVTYTGEWVDDEYNGQGVVQTIGPHEPSAQLITDPQRTILDVEVDKSSQQPNHNRLVRQARQRNVTRVALWTASGMAGAP